MKILSLTLISFALVTATLSGVTLNPSYTITIKPFPSKTGDTTEINQVVPLKFPAQAESGDYNVIGKIIKAEVKIGFVWIDVTQYLPEEQPMGSLKYTAPETAPTPTPALAPAPAPTPAPTAPMPRNWLTFVCIFCISCCLLCCTAASSASVRTFRFFSFRSLSSFSFPTFSK